MIVFGNHFFPPEKREPHRHKKNGSSSAGKRRAISRQKFISMTANATAALSFGTFIRSGLGAAKVNVLIWSNTVNPMDDVLREQSKEYTKAKNDEQDHFHIRKR